MDNHDEPDTVLMRRLQAGDDLALNDLMSRWQGGWPSMRHAYNFWTVPAVPEPCPGLMPPCLV